MDKNRQNQEESEAIFDSEKVEKWLSSLDVANGTKRLYRCGLRAFEEYVRESGYNPSALEEQDVLDFKHQLLETRAPATVSAYLVGVRSYYRWVADADDDQPDIAAHVSGTKRACDFKKDTLSPEQAERMLEAVWGDSELEKRNYAILNLMLRTGVRDIEVVRADVGDIDRGGLRPVLHVQGKGRVEKDAFVVLTDRALGPIEDYLYVREKNHGAATADAPLFASVSTRNHGGRLTTRTISGIAKSALRSIGIDDSRHTAHSLRHSAITYALLGDAKLEEAQQMARHVDVSTTQIYAHHVDRLRNAAEERIDRILD